MLKLSQKLLNGKIILFTVLTAPILMANFGGSPGGRTGGVADNGVTCATNGGCHGPKTPIPQEMISTNAPETGYAPGDTLTVTINATRNNINKYGFEIISEDTAGDVHGTFVGNSQVTGNGSRASHKAQSAQGSNDSISWEVQWVPPAAGTGDLRFFIAVLAANNNGGNGGDNLLIDTLEIKENLRASINPFSQERIVLYPNPTTDVIQFRGFTEAQKVTITDVFGRELETGYTDQAIDVSRLKPATYFAEISDKGSVLRKKFTKE